MPRDPREMPRPLYNPDSYGCRKPTIVAAVVVGLLLWACAVGVIL